MDSPPTRIPYDRCPLCDGPESAEIMQADCSLHPSFRAPLSATMRWLACARCGHIYVDGYWSPVGLAIVLAEALAIQSPGHELETTRYVSARLVESVSLALGAQAGRWLDVGFGNGALMTTAAEYGFDVTGLDLREATVAAMRGFGFDAQAIEFEDYRPEAKLDVISMADVLEHMPFPRAALAHAHGLLRDGGVLFLSMPNADSFLWQVLTRNGVNPYWAELEHYHNFGRKRLYALLVEQGFEPLRYAVSFRYRACMEVIARKATRP